MAEVFNAPLAESRTKSQKHNYSEISTLMRHAVGREASVSETYRTSQQYCTGGFSNKTLRWAPTTPRGVSLEDDRRNFILYSSNNRPSHASVDQAELTKDIYTSNIYMNVYMCIDTYVYMKRYVSYSYANPGEKNLENFYVKFRVKLYACTTARETAVSQLIKSQIILPAHRDNMVPRG